MHNIYYVQLKTKNSDGLKVSATTILIKKASCIKQINQFISDVISLMNSSMRQLCL